MGSDDVMCEALGSMEISGRVLGDSTRKGKAATSKAAKHRNGTTKAVPPGRVICTYGRSMSLNWQNVLLSARVISWVILGP
jgi:hypothetical protein